MNDATAARPEDPRVGVLWSGTDVVRPDEQDAYVQLASLVSEVTPHRAVVYGPSWWFNRKVARDVVFLLVPHRLPPIIRVSLLHLTIFVAAVMYVVSGQVRVLVSQSPLDALPLLAARRICRMLSREVQCVVQFHGDFVSVQNALGRSRYERLWRAIARFVTGRADLVRTISPFTDRLARSYGARRTVMFPTWTDLDLFVDGDRRSRGDVRRDRTFRILFAGVLTHVKGVDVLLEAVRVGLESGRSWELRVAGNGPLAADLQELAIRLQVADSVRWLGWLTREELVDEMDAADVLAVPSRTEGLGRVVLEAMARRLPVVASRVGGLSDLIEHGRTGWLVREDDPRAFNEALVDADDHPAGRRQYARRASETIAGRYSNATYLNEYRQMLRMVLA